VGVAAALLVENPLQNVVVALPLPPKAVELPLYAVADPDLLVCGPHYCVNVGVHVV
jgi:hypothetical protein